MKYIEINDWNRKLLFEKYINYDFPYISIGADIDITNLYHYAKKNNLSVYFSMIHTVVKAALEIENFKYRIKDKKPIICDALNPVFTYLPKGEEQFFLVYQKYEQDINSFCRNTQHTVSSVSNTNDYKFKLDENEYDILYITVIPWIQFTYFNRTIEKSGTDNIPRLSWGKFFDNEKGRKMMPFALQVHHGLMDGYHVGIFFEAIQENINQLI